MKWKKLGKGSYNVAYRSDHGTGSLVFKVAHDTDETTDLPERSVRLWNMINPHIRPRAQISREKINGQWVTGWICPYIEGREATDLEMRTELLAIFNRTGRVITDATAPRNFLTTHDGHTVCIDIGLALEGEARETASLIGLRRKPSLTSLEVWDFHASREGKGADWLNKSQSAFPKTIKTIKALLFIKNQRPDITNVDFLKKSSKTTQLLATAYDKGTGPAFNQAMSLLGRKQSPDLEYSKQRCRAIFLEYIYKVGTINQHDQFVPHSPEHLHDRLFIERAMSLMREVNMAQSCEACHAIVAQYVAELNPNVIADTSSESRDASEAELADAILYLEAETKDITVLDDIKKQCRDILGAYILSYEAREGAQACQNTEQYKLKLFIQRVTENVTMLIEALDDADSFEEMSVYLDDCAEHLPRSSNRGATAVDEPLGPIEGLLASVNFCRVMVASAQRAQQHTPSAETDSSLEF